MVVIHIKFDDTDQFIFETTCKASNDAVIRSLANIENSRHQIERLVVECERLGKYGPAKLPEKQGLDKYSEETIEKNEFYEEDPLGKRTGNGCGADLAKVINKTCEEAKAYISRNQALNKVSLTEEGIKNIMDNLRGAVTIAYPMGLPDYDPVKLSLEGKEEIEGTSASLSYLDPETCTLWWAGKEFLRNQTVGDRVGKNEKTMIIAKIQKKGSGPPQRQPAVSDEERKQMMALYYKKQEEMKQLAEDDEDDYLASQWADPKALKSALGGLPGDVKFR